MIGKFTAFKPRRQKKLRDNPHEVYLESKIVEIIRTTYELGHEHKFITKIIVRRAKGKIDPITKPDYKYLNKNDIEDMYLLCINDKVKDYRETGYQQKVNLTALTITFPAIEEYKLFNIVSKLVRGMIYENSKKEKRVMHRYADLSPSNDDADYLWYYEEDIEDHLKHHDQMRCWEILALAYTFTIKVSMWWRIFLELKLLHLFTAFFVMLVEADATLEFALATYGGRMVERENLSPQQPPQTLLYDHSLMLTASFGHSAVMATVMDDSILSEPPIRSFTDAYRILWSFCRNG
ncbi:hypothetical protein Tco_0675125 [Tanacetum coccineum]